jgi:chemotaxis response regulator CheB
MAGGRGPATRDIVVIGASADGVQTLDELVRPLPARSHPADEVELPAGERSKA